MFLKCLLFWVHITFATLKRGYGVTKSAVTCEGGLSDSFTIRTIIKNDHILHLNILTKRDSIAYSSTLRYHNNTSDINHKIRQFMPLTLFNTITNKEKSEVVKKLITHSSPTHDFYLLIILAVAMATIGLLLGNIAIVIGSMLISPILYAFLSFSLGFSISDTKLITRSLSSILKAAVMGIVVSVLITLFMYQNETANQIMSLTSPSLAYGVVAFIAGFAAAFTITKPELNETLPGIAIAVTIIPPISAVGIGLTTMQWYIVRDSLSLFALNAIAILAGSLIVFSLMNIYAKKNIAEQTLRQEENDIK